MLKAIPDWAAYWLKFQDDAIVMEATLPKPETAVGPTENRSSKIAEHIPSTAVVAATTNDLGKNLRQALDYYRSEPSFKSMIDQIDQGLGLVGGEDAAVGWVGDSAAVVDLVDGTPEGGLIVSPTDPENAQKLFTALRGFLALAGTQQGITSRTRTTTGRRSRSSTSATSASWPGRPARTSRCVALPAGHVQIAYAVTDQVVVIGSGPGFVKHVLDTTAGDLAGRERRLQEARRPGRPDHGDDLRRHHRHPRGGREGRQRQRSGRVQDVHDGRSSRSSNRSTR